MFICDFNNAVRQTVTVRGKTVRFDFSYRFGPLLTDKQGSPLKRQPVSERDPFWGPFERWLSDFQRTNPERVTPPAKSPSDQWDRRSNEQGAA